MVGGFTPNSPAEAAGLKVGDLLLKIDGKPVDHFTRIPELIGDRPAIRWPSNSIATGSTEDDGGPR